MADNLIPKIKDAIELCEKLTTGERLPEDARRLFTLVKGEKDDKGLASALEGFSKAAQNIASKETDLSALPSGLEAAQRFKLLASETAEMVDILKKAGEAADEMEKDNELVTNLNAQQQEKIKQALENGAKLKSKLETLSGPFAGQLIVVSQKPQKPDQPLPPDSEQEGPIDDKEAPSLANFFASVSNSLIQAQENLNRRSREYVASLDPLIPPAYFAIPSLKAEMKVGVRESTGKGINLILFTKSSQRQQYAESTVSFEVVAAPPPAAPTFGEYIAPMPGFLVLGEEKKSLLGRIRAEAAERAKTDKNAKTLGTSYENTEDTAAVLRYPSAESGEVKYLVLWPSRNVNQARDVWRETIIFSIRDKDGRLTADKSIFHKGDELLEDYVLIPDTGKLEDKTKDELENLIIRLGDTVQQAMLIISDWTDTFRIRRQGGASGEKKEVEKK